jgi:hypothetical protein
MLRQKQTHVQAEPQGKMQAEVKGCFLYCWLLFFETESPCATQAGRSSQSACLLCLLRAGITGVYHDAQKCGTGSADTWTSDLQSPEPWDNALLVL